MKTIIEKVYHCQHCKKYMLSAASMARHEKYCRMNPNNKHRCFDLCRYLQRKRIAKGYTAASEFRCEKMDIKMYSFLLEKKSTAYFGNPIKFDGLTRMPLKCIHHERMDSEEYEKRFCRNDEYEF